MTDEFKDFSEEIVKEVTKTAAKKKVVKKVGDPAIELFDIMFANSVKVGIIQTNYFSSKTHDIRLVGNFIQIKKIGAKDPVFTTLYNVIHWRRK